MVQCDKNLGPALIEREKYIKLVIRDHLSDANTYEQLTKDQAVSAIGLVRQKIESWIADNHKMLTRQERFFLHHHLEESKKHPFSIFYGTMKVHKTPLKTRPVVSYSGSIAWGLGVWIDSRLQIVARQQKSYFKDSIELKKQLDALTLPDNARLFTADAVSMYTNIPTEKGLHIVAQYLQNRFANEVPARAVMAALKIVMRNNIFQFGDLFFRQRTGTAMGAPPAPPWATIYMAVAENEFLPSFDDNLLFYRRFIDDVIGIWIDDGNQAKWQQLQAEINDEYFELEWEVSSLSKRVNYMDLTISIDQGKIHTTLYEKPNNLHLYIPPHSCHPPGVLQGMVFGCIHRIYTLCSDPADQHARTQQFYRHLSARGYKRETLAPLFAQAVTKAKAYTGPKEKQGIPKGAILFHLQYNPKLPPSREIQQAWRQNMLQPHSRAPTLGSLKNHNGSPNGLERLIVAYSRAPNLGNLLSSRKIKPDSGPPVSSYFDQGPND